MCQYGQRYEGGQTKHGIKHFSPSQKKILRKIWREKMNVKWRCTRTGTSDEDLGMREPLLPPPPTPTPGGGAVSAAVLPPAPAPPPPPPTTVVVIGNDGHAPAGTHPNVPNNVRNCIVTCFGSHPAHHLAICDALGCSAIVGMDWLVRHLVPYAVNLLESKPALMGSMHQRDQMVRRSIARSVRKFGLLFILFF